MTTTYNVQPIGQITTPFQQKFAIPRQPNLANARGTITMAQEFNDSNLLRGIEGYSHLWLLFMFHQTLEQGFKPTVKAPRLGGNQKTGVLATRSTFRPNGIGMSVVSNLGWEHKNGQLLLHVSGVDLLNNTPIIDIKPYLPYADSVNDARAEITEAAEIPELMVVFGTQAQQRLNHLVKKHRDLESLIVAVLSQDPRPAYRHGQTDDAKTYRVGLYDYDVVFRFANGQIQVLDIE